MEDMNIRLGSEIQLFNVNDTHLEKINNLNPKPPTHVRAEQIHARAMKLTGDQLNSQFGRFRTPDLKRLAEMTIGAPVMSMHNTGSMFGGGSLPLGRFFDGRVQPFETGNFTVNAFYFPRGQSGDELAQMIDLGVYAEASIGFVCGKLTCSECEHDIRTMLCEHYPGQNGVFYWYDQIKRVLEGSIVYRGAHPDTGMVRQDLSFMSLANDPQWEDVFQKNMNVALGLNLASRLNRHIDELVTDNRSRSDIIRSMASAAGISVSTVQQILAGEINCPPLRRLRGFARVLDVSIQSLTRAAERDGCNYPSSQQMRALTTGGYRRVC